MQRRAWKRPVFCSIDAPDIVSCPGRRLRAMTTKQTQRRHCHEQGDHMHGLSSGSAKATQASDAMESLRGAERQRRVRVTPPGGRATATECTEMAR